jgi:hypothetical protein
MLQSNCNLTAKIMGAISVPTLALTTNKAVADIPLSAKGQVTWYCTELTVRRQMI